MKHILLSLSAVFIFCSGVNAQKNVERPKLVVGIVVDQMRWDYLYRFYDRYEEGGLKRLMNEGFNCQNTFINYLPSFTAPGHSCVYTGSVPSIHGIAANDWKDNATGRSWYCTEDTTVRSVAGSNIAGKMSPRNLLASTITDELKLATNNKSKVFGIAIKDRGSILPAGHTPNGAFWFDDSTGNFISSTYYGNQLPGWMVDFNKKRYADTLISDVWQTMYPMNTYLQSSKDSNRYEGMIAGEKAPVFPHNAKKTALGYNALRYMPGGNTITFRAAKACVNAENLGKNDNTDFLCLSFSTTDYIGHTFAPNSIEIEDIYLRFDNELANFLKYLDKSVGKGNYTVFLTADHGGAHNAEYLRDKNIPAGADDPAASGTDLRNLMKTKFGTDKAILAVTNYQVYLDEQLIAQKKLDRKDIKTAVLEWLNTQPAVQYAADMENIANAAIPEPIKGMMINGYNRNRSGVIQIVLNPGWYSGEHGGKGTTHGSWNPYDTHIPLLWYGWGVEKGETFKETYMTDISATLAALLHIQMPNGCIGKVIEKALD
ncbi:MAG: alkaline phosphatase family protein [Sphingobacteriales bacterium]|nr:MAG: alkaline phosphatase family protein [Sphingobacteriales bacterium]